MVLCYRGDREYSPEALASALDGAGAVIVNYGLHYHNMTDYRREMGRMADQIADWVEAAGSGEEASRV
eukprot:206833-Prorocentrum_minimum.AAC.1